MKEVKQIVVLWALMVMAASCSQSNQPLRTSTEVGALSKSLFDSGTVVPDTLGLAVLNSTQGSYTDGGFIAPPSQTGTSNDGGSIGAPSVTEVPGVTDSTPTDTSGAGGSVTPGIIPVNPPVTDPGSVIVADPSLVGDSGSIIPDLGSSIGDSGSINSGTLPGVDVGAITPGTIPGVDVGAITPGTIPGVDVGAITPGTIPGVDVGAITPGTIPGVDVGAITPGTTPGVDVGAITPGTLPGVDVGAITPGTLPGVDVGAITPGTTPPGTITPGGSSGGCTQHPTNPKPSCSCSNPQPNQNFNVSLSRVCSIRRSNSKELFFEEAKHPLLTIEAVSNNKADPHSKTSFLASVGFSRLPTKQSDNVKRINGTVALAVASLKLERVDLLKGKFTSKLKVALNDLKTKLGSSWRFAYLNVRVCEDSNQDGFCFDESKINQLAFEVPSFKASALPKNLEVQVWSGRYLTLAGNPNQCEKQYSPLVFDLNGDGLHLIGPDSGVQFDINDSGNAVPTGWIGKSDEALLVRDLDRSGEIESGAELFGSATKLANGERAENGFEALKPLDSDNDGFITPRDDSWSELRLWVDRNQDGVSQRRELLSLDRLGIESINLNYVQLLEVDEYGNQARQRSTFIRRVLGKRYTLVVTDVWFNSY